MTAATAQHDTIPTVTELTLWKKPVCPQCTGASRWMDHHGLVYQEQELTAEENFEQLKQFKSAGFAQAPIIQFPEVRDGDEVLFEAQTVTGNRVDLIDAFAAATSKVSAIAA